MSGMYFSAITIQNNGWYNTNLTHAMCSAVSCSLLYFVFFVTFMPLPLLVKLVSVYSYDDAVLQYHLKYDELVTLFISYALTKWNWHKAQIYNGKSFLHKAFRLWRCLELKTLISNYALYWNYCYIVLLVKHMPRPVCSLYCDFRNC